MKKGVKNVKAKESALADQQAEVVQLREANNTLECSMRANLADYKREIREIRRQADLGLARAASGRAPGGGDTAKGLREALRKENAVLQELHNMSEALVQRGL